MRISFRWIGRIAEAIQASLERKLERLEKKDRRIDNAAYMRAFRASQLSTEAQSRIVAISALTGTECGAIREQALQAPDPEEFLRRTLEETREWAGSPQPRPLQPGSPFPRTAGELTSRIQGRGMSQEDLQAFRENARAAGQRMRQGMEQARQNISQGMGGPLAGAGSMLGGAFGGGIAVSEQQRSLQVTGNYFHGHVSSAQWSSTHVYEGPPDGNMASGEKTPEPEGPPEPETVGGRAVRRVRL